jgi:N-acetylglucosaminyldiphosphoundecaprenol N-acetyl-beta-D-mannosaminyltransferase
MPLIWMSRLLGVPLPERVTGSGLFERLRTDPLPSGEAPIKVFFFGGPPGVAEVASRNLNAKPGGLVCVGFETPGFGSVDDMSTPDVLARINASKADFLVVALGAVKGQAWIQRNRAQLSVPVISHLGAVVNFVAGTVSRAPSWIQKTGLEWLWRIKEEPTLWRRYWHDGTALIKLLFGQLLPHARWLRQQPSPTTGSLSLVSEGLNHRLSLTGSVADPLPADCLTTFEQAAAVNTPIWLDLTPAKGFVPGFAGPVLRLERSLRARQHSLQITPLPAPIGRIFVWNGLSRLLTC